MRLKRGDKVEVLSNHKASSGSWSCAEILSGNGHTYSIRYSSFPIEQDEAVRRVPRKAIRPCPPTVKEPNSWFPGDLAEVCHNFDWKPAKIMKLVGNDSYIVRLLGSPLEITVEQSNLRLRQAWQDGKWFMLRKNCYVPDSIAGDSEMSVRIKSNILKTKDPQMFSILQKRKLPLESSNPEELKVYAHKSKVAENDIRLLPSLPKSTHAYSPQKLQKTSLSSFPTRNISVPKVDISGRDQELFTRASNHIHIGSCASSVCSTSYISNVSQLPSISVPHPSMNVEEEDYFSDAESSTGQGYKKERGSFLTNEEARAKFHRSELRVYRSFINTMYASGPLRWEDEVELSNIRSSLHISNGEHLTVLRQIMFPKGKTSVI